MLGRGCFLVSLSADAVLRSGGSMRAGLRVGYVLAPYSSSWHLGGSTLSDSPAGTLAGPFVRLSILP